MKFEDFAQISPKVQIHKNTLVSFVEMADLVPSIRSVKPNIEKTLKGSGSKFSNYDTLFSRITPCLQNGKISQVKNLKNGVGFGSTEFFVFRGKKGVSISDFVYYLSQSELIKEPAIKSMVGASGRQRADLDVIRNIEIEQFSIDDQVQIVDLLSNYDNLIENNNRRIAILEVMAQSFYREWFVNFRYPNHEDNLDAEGNPKLIDSPLGQIPEGWEVKEFSTSFDFWNGKKCTKSEAGMFDLYGANGIVGKAEDWKYENAVIIGRVGAYCGAVEYCFDKFWGSDNTIVAKCKSEKNISYLFLLLEHFNLNKYAGGSAQPLLTQTTLKQLKYIAPPEDLVEQFELVVHKLFDSVVNLKKRNQNLKQQRDMLLPKLISGQIKL